MSDIQIKGNKVGLLLHSVGLTAMATQAALTGKREQGQLSRANRTAASWGQMAVPLDSSVTRKPQSSSCASLLATQCTTGNPH